MAFAGAIQLAYNRDQLSYRQLGNQKRSCGTSTSSRRHHPKILQVKQTHQRHCLLQKIYTSLQTAQGQQASNHPFHTRSGPSSDLLCEDGTVDSFTQEIKDLMEQRKIASISSLKTLHSFIDKEGLLRVGGRLQQSTLPYQAMHQMILPANHHFTKLVFSAEHLRLHHAGPQLLIASLCEKY